MLSQDRIEKALQYLEPEERAALQMYLLPARLLWYPLPGPQTRAYFHPAHELLVGGAGGGGKTDLLLGLGVTAHHNSVIFRREYTQFSGARGLVERSDEILGGIARWNGQRKVWSGIPVIEDKNDSRKLEFGAVQYRHSVNRFKGRPHDLKAFDELTEFTEYQYTFLSAWARTIIPDQRVRVVGASNPPAHQEGEWVIRRWGAWLDPQHSNPAKPGETRWFATIDGKSVEVETGDPIEWKTEVIYPQSRSFIPARVTDNPYLMETGYDQVLSGLPEPLRSQLLYGDFTVGTIDDPWQVIPTDWVRQAQARWEKRERPDTPMTALGVDPARGGGDETVMAPRYDNYFDELIVYPGRMTPDGPHVAGLIINTIDLNSAVSVNLDVVGIGSSVYDSVLLFLDVEPEEGEEETEPLFQINPVNFGAGTHARDKSGQLAMANIRAAAYWALREALDPVTGDDLALPPDTQLLADLVVPKWRPTARGVVIESKESVSERLGRSPDRGDAVALSLWMGGVGGMNWAFA